MALAAVLSNPDSVKSLAILGGVGLVAFLLLGREGLNFAKNLGCDPGSVLDAGLCYDPPKPGYTCKGPVCWQNCPSNCVSEGGRDDGAYCGKGNYSDGVGKPIHDCPTGKEKVGLLCLDRCRSGYKGVGSVCWEDCKEGYTDDGAVCRMNAHITSADNSDWPLLDKCGLTFAKGCSKCPAGYKNDGCTCRRDVHVYGKGTYNRGPGTPLGCGPDEEYDAGLCYKKSRRGYKRKGPVSWQECPGGMNEIGVSCQKKTYSRGVGKPVTDQSNKRKKT